MTTEETTLARMVLAACQRLKQTGGYSTSQTGTRCYQVAGLDGTTSSMQCVLGRMRQISKQGTTDDDLKRAIDLAVRAQWLEHVSIIHKKSTIPHVRVLPAGSNELATDECKEFFALQRQAEFVERFQNRDRSIIEQEKINELAALLYLDAKGAAFDHPPELAVLTVRLANLTSRAFKSPIVNLPELVWRLSDLISKAQGLPDHVGNPSTWADAAIQHCIDANWIDAKDGIGRITMHGYDVLESLKRPTVLRSEAPVDNHPRTSGFEATPAGREYLQSLHEKYIGETLTDIVDQHEHGMETALAMGVLQNCFYGFCSKVMILRSIHPIGLHPKVEQVIQRLVDMEYLRPLPKGQIIMSLNHRDDDAKDVVYNLEKAHAGAGMPNSRSPLFPASISAKALSIKNSVRFSVALSFPGEARAYVSQVAGGLASEFGRDAVFYDEFFNHELARPDLDTYLQSIYHDESELLVVFLGGDYSKKDWCYIEWRAIRDIIKNRRVDDVMFFRTDDQKVDGVLSIDGYIDTRKYGPAEGTRLIIERLNHNRRMASV